MKSRIKGVCACLLPMLFLVLWVSCARASAPPTYSWGAFQRFWNSHALLGVEIVKPVSIKGGYFVSFGYSASLSVFSDGNYVTGVQVQFRNAPGLEAGGPKFLRAIQTVIRIGTYGWPEERVLAVRKTFEHMLPDRKVYQWRNSRFTRIGYSTGDWEFTLELIHSED